MSILEVTAIAISVIYTIVVGSFLNAAITSPDNCRRALRYIRRSPMFIFLEMAWLIGLLLIGFHARGYMGRTDEVAPDYTIGLLFMSHFLIQPLLLAIYLLADAVAEPESEI